MKGAVHLTEPSGEVRCQGGKDQQWQLYDILQTFTDDWDRPLEMPKVYMAICAATLPPYDNCSPTMQ